MVDSKLVEKAAELIKRGFVPMPGGQPPMDPAMMQAGGMSMDPAMAAGGAPMDPAMMQAGGMSMDPAMAAGGQPPMSVLELPPEEFYAMLVAAFSEAMATAAPQQQAPAPAQPAVPAEGGESGEKSDGNAEIVQKLDKVIELLGGNGGQGAAPAQPALPPLVPSATAPGFVGAGGMTAQASVEEIPDTPKKTSLADMILSTVKKAGK